MMFAVYKGFIAPPPGNLVRAFEDEVRGRGLSSPRPEVEAVGGLEGHPSEVRALRDPRGATEVE